MANPHKGEIELKAEGKVYVLRYSIDAICSIEEKTGKTFLNVVSEMHNPATMTVTMMREILHAGLAEHHPEMSLKESGELLVAAGGVVGAMKKVNDAFGAAFPKAEASGTPRPPNRAERRKAGTGPVS
jgi:hypothetical protein